MRSVRAIFRHGRCEVQSFRYVVTEGDVRSVRTMCRHGGRREVCKFNISSQEMCGQ